MEFVIGNIDNILANQKTELNDEVKITFGNINSKSELRRNMAQMAYFIMNDKEIEPQTKIQLITELQGTYNKAKEELIKKKLVVEDEDEKVKTQQVELNKRIVLAKHPNRNGNLLKSININVNASKYPISARDQVDFFLLDIAEEFDMLMNPDKADEKLQDKLSRVIETTDKFIPNDFSKGKNTDTTDDDKNKAAPKASDVKSLQDEVKEIEEAKKLQKKMKNAYSNNPLTSTFSMFGFDNFPYDDNEVIEAYKHYENTVDNKKKAAGAAVEDEIVSNNSSKNSTVSLGGKKRKTRKNRKNTGGTKLSREERDKLRDALKTRRNESIRKGTPYPRPRTTAKTLNEIGHKFMDNLFFPRDKRAYLQLERMKNIPTEVEDLENRTQTNDFVQEAKEDPVAQGYASLANNDEDQLDNLSPDEQDLLIERTKSIAEKNPSNEKIKKDAAAREKAEEFQKLRKREKAEEFQKLRKRFRKNPTLTAIQVARDPQYRDNKRTYRPEELQYRTQTISEPLQKEMDAILEKRRNKAVEQYERKKEEELYNSLGGKKRKTKKNKKKNQKRKTSKRKQKQK